MTPHRRIIAHGTIRQVQAVNRSMRLAGRLAAVVTAARRAALDQLPDDIHFANAVPIGRRIEPILKLLAIHLGKELRAGLANMAEWGHARTAQILTDRAKAIIDRNRREAFDPTRFYSDLLIDPPSADQIGRLVGSAPQRLTGLIDPTEAASVVWNAIAAGQDRRYVARSLTDLFDGFEVSARRVARTEGLRVATASQLAASEQLHEWIPAYQINAVLDSRTRPEHRARNGTIYYRNPKPGQLGFDVMPRPPIDQPGNRLAWNCRCYLSPVFDLSDVNSDPDDHELAKFFDLAGQPDREMIAGEPVEKFRITYGRLPGWMELAKAI